MHPRAKGGKGGHIVAQMRPSFRMTIGTDPTQVAGVGRAFGAFAEAHKVPDAVRRSVSVALDELLNNSCAHGSAGEVSIDVELQTDRLSVTLSDDGTPFNPLDLAAPDLGLSLDERPIGGLGVHLTRQIMDEVAYQRRSGRNVITLAKYLS
ncbi:MAG TPA: ATP-binding protein [Gemmatimonadales bacterium]|nr:ATP-binding protein [Gemmatimonadales bacterium]